MNLHYLAAVEYHCTFLNTLQTAILYDLCLLADEDGKCKPNNKRMADRWRVHLSTLRNMLRELKAAGVISWSGRDVRVHETILKCPEGCRCPLSGSPKDAPKETLSEAAPKPEKKPKKRFDILKPPDPGSVSGIYEKLKTHWRTRWGTAILPGYIERSCGETIRAILSEPVGSLQTLNNFERAFVNYLKSAKDTEAGKLSLRNFCSTWGVWVNDGHNTTQEDAVSALKDALEL